MRAQTGLEGPYLLYLSRLEHPGKNHLRLLQAYAESPVRHTHRLALVGPDWGAGHRIQLEIQRLNLEDRVRIVGYVGDEHVPGLISEATAVIAVGLREGFGLPALEALAMGRPVVVSNTGALPEVVGELGILCIPTAQRTWPRRSPGWWETPRGPSASARKAPLMRGSSAGIAPASSS